ncbi:MAG TPA: sigma-70 family RNA polymerase sigma factor [Myxococcales bacterium]|nr:sigma-70 family RNA polymerase sigma factor [Myxococcales bacterium]
MSLDVERLYRSHGHLVLRRARTLLGNEQDAQEALQEVFLALLRGPAADVRNLTSWLYGATTHFCLNQLRNRATSARLLEQRGPAVSEAPARAEALAEVRGLLAQLPEQVALAVVYHHLDGMTHDEVAAMLGCSRRQVGYLLERATARMEQSA